MKSMARINREDLHSLFSIVMYLDRDMAITYASGTLRKCVPATQEPIALCDVFDFVRPANLDTFQSGLDSVGSLCLLTAKNGSFAIRGQLIHSEFNDEEVLCFYGAPWLFWIDSNAPDVELGLDDFAAQDVQLDQLFFMSTEKKMVEDLEQLNSDLSTAKIDLEEAQEAQKQFFAQMSHEIRTPLNGVTSALSLLDHEAVDKEQAEYMRLAQSSAENLLEVINYVLSVSKLELAPSVDHVIFSWPELIRSTIDVVKARADEKSIAMYMDLAEDLPVACYGSRDRFRQTLLNLLINAIKFTNDGSITVRASSVSRSDEHYVLRLEVADTGIGIAKDELKKIFQPFYTRTPDSVQEKTEGTGLGLDIARRNVHTMGGKLMVDSTPGEGTTFSFELLVEATTKDDLHAQKEEDNPSEDLAPLVGNILLVDDNETNLILGSKILEAMGMEVVSVNGGAKAVKEAKNGGYDLILMDLTMPEVDGIAATRQIRKFSDLPIIALTAHVDEAEKEFCLNTGMNDYLTKPIVRHLMHKTLAQWLTKAATTTAQSSLQDSESALQVSAAATNDASNADLIDMAVIDDLVSQIGKDNLYEVIDKVRSESQTRWQELSEAISENDEDARRRHVHSLQSIFRSIGLTVLGESLAAIELRLRAGEQLEEGWMDTLEETRIASLQVLDAL